MVDIRSAAETVFRQESGRIIAGLIRISGSFDRAEEAMQEAFASALVNWQVKGIPTNPAAWIMTTAHRRLIDVVRRERTTRQKLDALAYETDSAEHPNLDGQLPTMDLPDDRLRLIFTCCHPSINTEAQVALTLRTLGGLTTPEIAKAFLVPEPTLAQRLVRAKRKIQEARIPYEVPRHEKFAERLNAVRAVVYLIFNEGYTASSGPELVRRDLCAEAVRLGRLLCELLPGDPENTGLLALMLLHDSRRNARISNGELVTLEEQDRSLWDRSAIEEGTILLEQALRRGPAGPYQLQAAVAALHAEAKTPEETDWPQIAALYGKLFEINPSPVVALNHAVAIAMAGSLAEGLQQVDEVGRSGTLAQYYLFHAARAELLRRLNRAGEAVDAYEKAISTATNPIEIAYLQKRLREMRARV